MIKEVKEKFNNYPVHIKPLMLQLRELVFSVAEELNLGEVEETLKWGEPSYRVKSGSPLRMDWKEKSPDHYSLFFNCQTILVETFRELYSHVLTFEGNREIVLKVNEALPENEIRHCIELAMTYKNVKHLPLLGS